MTFTGGRGETIIDYVMGDRGAWDRLEVWDEVDSDHHSVTVWLGKRGEGRRDEREKREEWVERVDWSEEAREEYRKKTEEIEIGKGGMNEELEKLMKAIKGAVRVKRRKKNEKGRSGWWDRECKRKNKEAERVLREWRKGNKSRQDYRRKKREYKELCERKRRQKNEEWVKVAKEARTQEQVWKVINKERRRKVEVNKEIGIEEWDMGSVVAFGVEVWRWKEWNKIERLQERYMRWVLGVEGRTPGYMVREEGKKEKMRTKLGRRAMGYEEKLEKGGGENGQENVGKREREVSLEWVRMRREEGREGKEEIEGRDIEMQQQERFERVQKSKWNRWYKDGRVLGIPQYLYEKGKEERMIRVARFRLGSEMREGRYWEEEEGRRCRSCGWEEESWEHVVEVCMREGEEGGRGKILDSGGGRKGGKVDEETAKAEGIKGRGKGGQETYGR
ncbi:hypothetical protein EAG_02771 [Camponotus floridanus]|uniref:Endonuclease/exonuclease/phosphatase domain-containing protein n=1 Tax=Camponotus floridanus TaxID=104421 RepID=E2AHN7_CAMFO|nr:hypothetical protein EAG_02771 [Camponotus floridanus]